MKNKFLVTLIFSFWLSAPLIVPTKTMAQSEAAENAETEAEKPKCSAKVKKVHKQICSSGRQQWTVCTVRGVEVSKKAGSCVGS